MTDAPTRTGGRDRGWRLAPWLAGYRPGWLRADVLAGLTVWAVLVPESLAYATIAGVPPVVGLYAAVPALVVYALLGSSRHLVVGPMSATAALSGSIAAVYGNGTPAGVLTVSIVLTLVVGLTALVAGLLKLGFLSSFISEPVLKGFIVGLALMIVIGQVPKLLDVDKPEHGSGFFASTWQILRQVGDVHWLSAAVGVLALVVVLGLRRRMAWLPGALVVVVLGILASHVFGLEGRGVQVVGRIEPGLPVPGLPGAGLRDYLELAGPALGVVLIAFVEGLAAAKAYAAKFRYRLDTDRELTALGASNLGSGLFGGMVVNGSLSKTAVNGGAGARTQASNLVVATLTVLTLLFLTGLFESLPEPVLAAIVIAAVIELVDFSSLRRFYRVWSASSAGRLPSGVARPDFVAALGALFGVLVFDTLPGLFIGIGLSLLLMLFRASRPNVARLVRLDHGWVDAVRAPGAEAAGDVVVLRVEAALFFANSELVADAVRDAAARPGVRAVVLDAASVPWIDVTAVDTLAQLLRELREQGVQLSFAQEVGQVREVVSTAGHEDLLPALYPSVDAAVASARREPPPAAPDS